MDNFLCVSSYNNNLDWLKHYKNPHLIYDKTWNGGLKDNNHKSKVSPSNLKKKYPELNIINSNNYGYNIYDYLTYIIDNYQELPPVIVFMKGNTIGRHVSEECFKKLVNNKYFTCIEDFKYHDPNQKSLKNGNAYITCEGGWMEKNTNWYIRDHRHPIKFFDSYNSFLSFCFIDPVYPKYIRFPPGGCYIVPKQQLLKYEITFYKNLREFVSYARIPCEGLMIERALYTIWNCNFEVSKNMKKEIDYEQFIYPSLRKKKFFNFISRSRAF